MIEKAKKDYLAGMKYKDLAEKYDVSINTVKSWVKRHGWSELKKTKGCTQNEKGAPKKEVQEGAAKKSASEEIVVPNDIDKELVDKVMENEDLTDKQRLFCIHYIKCFNASKAALKAGYSKEYCGEIGYQLLQKTTIKDEIEKLKQHRLNRNMLTEDDIFQKMMDIAFADITDYTEFGSEDVPALHPDTRQQLKDENGEPITYKSNYVYFKNSGEVDGSLITEVSQGKDGVKVKLADRMKALQWLGDRIDLLSTAEREKLSLAREKFEFEKENSGSMADEPIEITITRKE